MAQRHGRPEPLPASYADGRRSEYVRVVYMRGACALHDLERVLGGPAMTAMLRGYVRDHWLGVATTAGFSARHRRRRRRTSARSGRSTGFSERPGPAARRQSSAGPAARRQSSSDW